MDSSFFVAILVIAGISGFIGIQISKMRGRSEGEGFALGFFLGPIGWFIEAMQTDLKQVQSQTAMDGRARRKCPHCAEMILSEAKVCKHCGRDVPQENAAKSRSDRIIKEAQELTARNAQTEGDASFVKILVFVVLVCMLIVIVLLGLYQPARI